MKLYNSLTKKIKEFKPIKHGEVALYTCGPTVYDHAHIGNLRTYIFEDTLRRALKLNGYNVKHVMNFTDIDDKTIARSQTLYPKDQPDVALSKLTKKYERIFIEDAQTVGIDFSGTRFARATENIDQITKLIERIPNKYIADDGVYFDLSKYKGYGALVKIDSSHQHHRINNDEYDKDHVADFALWKLKNGNEPSWDLNIDGKLLEGRPGWHIECSAMATHYLPQPFDIHTGGVDLKFPHHENEIAQSKAASGKALANCFLHAEHLLVDGKKMSKSLKNFYTLQDVIDKGFHPLAFRLLVLQAHYRSQLNFTWKSLKAAQGFLQKLYAWADLRWQVVTDDLDVDYSELNVQFLRKISNDLDTPGAISLFSRLPEKITSAGFSEYLNFMGTLDEMLGLDLSNRIDIGSEQKTLITKHVQARQDGDYTTSDAVRDELKAQGIGLNDNSYGVTWYRLI